MLQIKRYDWRIPLKNKMERKLIMLLRVNLKIENLKNYILIKVKNLLWKNFKYFLRVMKFIGSHLKVNWKLKFMNDLIEQ